jgi:hypothetical protein
VQCEYTQLSAKDAFAAGGDAGNEDAVCRLQHYDGRTDLFDHADALVAEPASLTGGNVTLEDGKVGAANRRQSHSRCVRVSSQRIVLALAGRKLLSSRAARLSGRSGSGSLPSAKPNLSADDFRSLSLLARHIR